MRAKIEWVRKKNC